MTVNKKQMNIVPIINVISKVIISKVYVSIVVVIKLVMNKKKVFIEFPLGQNPFCCCFPETSIEFWSEKGNEFERRIQPKNDQSLWRHALTSKGI